MSMSIGTGFPRVGLLGAMGGGIRNMLWGVGRTGFDMDCGVDVGVW